jgi:putative IMPACT (imprinted ancient) family translation regulator
MIITMAARIAGVAEHKLTVDRSVFLARVFPAATVDDAKRAVAARARELRKARHHCWACRVRDPDGSIVEQARDDGEVGRPGMVLLELLRAHDLLGAVVVSRLFGGVKLGPGGVSRAFREAAGAAIDSILR